jgi:ATP-dependent RNA helicase DDX52/ROK1
MLRSPRAATDDLDRIANIILQSGSTVPEWILKLPKPSKLKRRQMGKVKRSENVNSAARIGRAQAIKKRSVVFCPAWVSAHVWCRDMIAGSKRRKVKGETALVSRVEADDE